MKTTIALVSNNNDCDFSKLCDDLAIILSERYNIIKGTPQDEYSKEVDLAVIELSSTSRCCSIPRSRMLGAVYSSRDCDYIQDDLKRIFSVGYTRGCDSLDVLPLGLFNSNSVRHIFKEDFGAVKTITDTCEPNADPYDILVYKCEELDRKRELLQCIADGIPVIGYTNSYLKDFEQHKVGYILDRGCDDELALEHMVAWMRSHPNVSVMSSLAAYRYAANFISWDVCTARWIDYIENCLQND